MVLCVQEILSGKTPYSHISALSPIAELAIIKAIRGRKLPPKPPEISGREAESLWRICLNCWKHKPRKRMTVGKAIKQLTSLINAPDPEWDPPAGSSRNTFHTFKKGQVGSRAISTMQPAPMHAFNQLPADFPQWAATKIGKDVRTKIKEWKIFPFYLLTPEGIKYSKSQPQRSGKHGTCNSAKQDKRNTKRT